MKSVKPYIDLHIHQGSQQEDVISVYNLLIHETEERHNSPFSAGLHPWYADQLSTTELVRRLDLCASNPNLLAFGETGLDKSCNVSFQLQKQVFEIHLEKAVEHNKPVVIHCVKAWEELIRIAANYPIIKVLHGYNGSPQMTERLVHNGFRFSIGKRILDPGSKIQTAIHLIPLPLLFCETDTSDISISIIYTKVSSLLHIPLESLKSIIFENYSTLRDSSGRVNFKSGYDYK
jgi:TatD DNase family protein